MMRKNHSAAFCIRALRRAIAAVFLAGTAALGGDLPPGLSVAETRCEYAVNPLGIDEAQPRFSWTVESAERGQTQTAYRVLVSSSKAGLDKNLGDKWDSGRVESGRSVNVVYGGVPLSSREACWWKVRSWNQSGAPSNWSEPSTFEMGLLESSDWKGKWIGLGTSDEPAADASSPLLRNVFELKGKALRARAYFSGIGWSELYVNGQKVSEDVLSPGLTDYSQEILYRAYDVTSLVKQGPNAIGIMLGNGWFSSPNILPAWAHAKPWANRPQAILQLVVTYEDLTVQQFFTDETWKATTGAVGANHKNPGEEYDARQEKPNWNAIGCDDREWEPANVRPSPGGRLTCQTVPPIKVQATLTPVKKTSLGDGVWGFEFDRFFAGWVRLKVAGAAGTKITVQYGAGERDIYVLKGTPGGEVYEPRFTFHPVRNVRIEGLPREPPLDSVEGREVYSDVDLYGNFTCSNELLNRIHDNIQRTLKVGLKGFILDGVHREPIAYNEPASIFGSLSTRKFMPELWTRFARNIQLAGSANGDLSDVVPRLPGMNRSSDVSQNGSYPMLIWYLYQCYGDDRLLGRQYEPVKAWVEFIQKELADQSHIVRKGWLGEHMLPGPKPGEEFFISPETPKEFIWTCLYCQNARVVSNMALALGKKEDADHYGRFAEEIRGAINKTWLDSATGHYASRSQTSEILPLSIGIVPEECESKLISNLSRTISEANAGKLRVGHVGLPGFMESLVDKGLGDTVYSTVNRTDYPGWGYMVSQGATTVWEAWGEPAKTNREESMTMLTGVCRFFYEGLAGIREPGFYGKGSFAPAYGRIQIRPHVLGDLKSASASIKTVRGIISSGWNRSERSLVMDVAIPANAVATVSVPILGMKVPTITEGSTVIWTNGAFIGAVAGVTGGNQESEYVTFDVGSGKYQFTVRPHEGPCIACARSVIQRAIRLAY